MQKGKIQFKLFFFWVAKFSQTRKMF
jgi:hypothetical protein